MKILLSGGSGFIGRNLINFLEKNYDEYKILSISRNALKKNTKKVSYIKLDFNEIEKKFDRVKKFNPDVFLHLAWEDIPNYSEEISKKNYINSLKIINLVMSKTSCQKIISTGTCWEYNDGNLIGKCTEDMFIQPSKFFSMYKTKIYQEVYKIAKKKKVIFNWLRLFYVYGLYQKNRSIVPSLINAINNNVSININFPSNKNDFIYIDDVVKIISGFIFSEKPTGIYNVGTGKSTSICDLLKIIDFEINNNYILSNKYLDKIDISKFNQNFYACTKKLKNHFNNICFIDIRKGIQKILENNKNRDNFKNTFKN